MKMCLTPPVPAPGAWLIAGRSAAGAVLLAVAVSACTAGGSGSSVPSIFTPTTQTSGHATGGTRTPSPTGGGGSTSAHPATHSSGAASASTHAPSSSPASSHASASSSSSPHASASATPTPVHSTTTPAPTHTPAATPTSAPASSTYPTAAPETGGGGTAGLQDGLLFGVGGLAVFAGLGTLSYRRRLSRKFGLGKPDPRAQPDREPADR
jgi:hypothetical protein